MCFYIVEVLQLSVSFRAKEKDLQGGRSEPKKRTYRAAIQSQRRGPYRVAIQSQKNSVRSQNVYFISDTSALHWKSKPRNV